MAKNGSITPKQRRFLETLIMGVSVAQACRLTGTAERTAYRWLQDDAFKKALAEAEGELMTAAMRRLLAMQDKAITQLADVLNDRTARNSEKIKAVELALSHVLRVRTAVSLEERLAALEKTIQTILEGEKNEHGKPDNQN